ncbi:hypothetical protein [Phaeobacter sp. J2-8]|uniref:hypothetical protein n=1 Tax=Phaeobacter sp. J2-8 TaxID=2931394 RepID=UPI001FD17046|nr:hypothetical protein [Phaeobacter sp. J2-8]MCJ7874239.1 hypothetical protein [Phaeobacter sp. J2-8]
MTPFFPLAHATILLFLGIAFQFVTRPKVWDRLVAQRPGYDPVAGFVAKRWPVVAGAIWKSARYALRVIGLIAIAYGMVVWAIFVLNLL